MSSNKNNNNKPLVLGSDIFKFVADFTSNQFNEQKEINNETGHSESEESSNEIYDQQCNVEDDFSKLATIDEEQKNEPKFKLLSKAEDEYSNNSEVESMYTNYLKGCKWSPDGSCILTNSDDSILRIYDLTNEMIGDNETTVPDLKPSLRMTPSEIIYDYAWYPFMESANPTTACLFVTSKDNPIHLYDAFTGQIRCSYKGYNHLDELVNSYCISFNTECSKIYCGYDKYIKIFDISRPGKNYTDIKTSKDPYKLPGIVSSIAFSPTQNGVYAAGTYSKYIGIYIENNNEVLCIMECHSGGITHLMFSKDGNRLYSGARKDEIINCWDMRNPGKILNTFKRDVSTNQRIYFDLFEDSKYLVSGSNDGTVNIWNTDDTNVDNGGELSFKAHNDCVNGVSFHPNRQLLATTCGQRKFKNEFLTSDSDSDCENISNVNEEISKKTTKLQMIYENSLKIWKISI
jgi:telomerase Cajal body protein 1